MSKGREGRSITVGRARRTWACRTSCSFSGEPGAAVGFVVPSDSIHGDGPVSASAGGCQPGGGEVDDEPCRAGGDDRGTGEAVNCCWYCCSGDWLSSFGEGCLMLKAGSQTRVGEASSTTGTSLWIAFRTSGTIVSVEKSDGTNAAASSAVLVAWCVSASNFRRWPFGSGEGCVVLTQICCKIAIISI